ncbi:nuclear transport factor 2 family protein [Antrihabitans sp. YC3-6]|uniref:Nuclear transport factor 2 family protein n=1 Tax=Antrihabitans stalagmiti TaxID=2799499 RepID=A0A934NQV2_9NOCA|nr:nuclear transport factor 2 family protein [Antrihabitans stalagmiti]MBJ8339748.1 nuclear transport factor 2 family protein [Antrihabitans stalagmiti]
MTTATNDLAVENLTRLVDDYLSGWNEVDSVEREEILVRCWAPDAALVDPPLDGRGHAGIDALIQALQEHYPDHRFVRSGEIDAHHDAFRFPWRLVGPNGEAALTGVDYGLVGDDGRLTRVTGFFDPAAGAGQ